MRKDNLISNFSDYTYSLNEGSSYKKDFGVLGPFENWGYKIRTSCPEMGGGSDENCIIVSDLDGDDQDLCLKYLYSGKESDPIYIPKSCFEVSGNSKNPILQTKSGTRWWEEEKNQDSFDDFINSFLESKHFEPPQEDSAEDDIQLILDILGIDSPISDFRKKKDLYWVCTLEDGTELELKKRDNDNFLKNLKIYLGKDSYSPEVEVSHESPGFETIFSTPKGKFVRKTPNLTDLSSEPIHKYLFHSSLKKDPSLHQEPVINYLNSVLKSHDWRPQSKKNQDSVLEKEKEISQLKKILSNTISEENLDEMYSKARERFSPDPKEKESPKNIY